MLFFPTNKYGPTRIYKVILHPNQLVPLDLECKERWKGECRMASLEDLVLLGIIKSLNCDSIEAYQPDLVQSKRQGPMVTLVRTELVADVAKNWR